MERSGGGNEVLTVVVELDDQGWVARVRDVSDARVTGACLSEVRRRVQSLVSRRFGDGVAIREQIRIDTDATQRVAGVRGARDELEQAREDLREQMMRTAALLRQRGLSSRDVGTLLGVSQQRVSQLWRQSDARRERERGRERERERAEVD